jgi:hypothetical protein
MMKFRLGLFALPFITATATILLAGCSSTTNTTASQSVYEIAWLPDESGMLAYIDKVSISSLDGSAIEGQNLYHVSSDGTIGNSINPADANPNQYGYPPVISVSPDGHTAITGFGTDIYRVDLSGGNVTDIIQNANLLGVSPDMKFAATTVSSANNTAKLLALYDLSTSPIRLHLPKQTVAGAASNRILWIDGSHFAITIFDSVGSDPNPYNHVTIFDTNGGITHVIPNAQVSLHASAYASKSGDLFVLNHALGIDRIHLATDSLTHIITNDSVESMDVSSDGSLLVYSSGASTQSYSAFAVNVGNGHTQNIGSSVITPILSPNADRVAFIHQLSGNSSDIQVVTATLPQ